MNQIQIFFNRFDYFIEEGILVKVDCFAAKYKSSVGKSRNANNLSLEHLGVNVEILASNCQLWIKEVFSRK